MKIILSGIRAAALAALALAASWSGAPAQTAPNWTYGYVPSPAEWNAAFAGKQNYLGAAPLLTTGGTMSGRLTTAMSTSATAGLNLPPGTAPASPVNGDLWTTPAGLFVQVNGSTVGPLASAGGGSFTATPPVVVSFPGGGVTNYSCPTCGVTGSPLSQFAATTSAQLAGVITNETGTGALVFGTGPTLAGVTVTTSFSAAGLVGLPNLASQAANTILGATTAGSPTALPVPNCNTSSSALWWTSGSGLSCGTITAAAASISVGGTVVNNGPGILYNASSGANLAAVAPAANSVLVTNGSSAPSLATTLPSGLAIPAPAVSGGTVVGVTSLGIRSAGTGAFDLTISNIENLTAGRALVVTLNDATRTLNMGGNVATGGAFTTAGAFPLTLTQTAATNVTLPTTGTLATLANSEALTNKTVNGLTITSTTGTLTVSTGKTLAAFNSLGLVGTDGTLMTFPTTTATIARTDAGQTFTGAQTINNGALVVGGTGGSISATGADAAFGAGGNRTFLDVSGANGRMGSLNGGGSAVGLVIYSNGVAAMNINSSAQVTFTQAVTAPQVTVSTTSSSCLVVGANGATNPALQVDCSASSAATGLLIKSNAAGSRTVLSALSSATNEILQIDAKGSGGIVIGSISTGNINMGAAGGGITLAGTLSTSSMVIAGGAAVTSLSLTTGSITVDCTTRPQQYITGNTAAWSITAPATDGSCVILLTNAASSAVIPTFSGFSVGSNTGDSLTSVGSSKFLIWVARVNGTATYSVKALQ